MRGTVKRSTLSILISIFLFAVGLSLFSFSDKAFAIENSTCQPTKGIFKKVVESLKDVDIRRTILNQIGALITDIPCHIIASGSCDQMMSCMKDIGTAMTSAGISTNVDSCADEYDAEYCKSFFNQYSSGTTSSLPDGFAGTRVAGSLLGMTYSMENATYEPIPLNLAYFYGQKVQAVPFVGRALAAPVSGTYGPFVATVYQFWEAMRNVAYGVLAIVLLVMGFMILGRKQIGQQTVVTVQYAIPKVVMAVVLITFSYPIGATIATVGWNVAHSARGIVTGSFLGVEGMMGLAAQLMDTSVLGVLVGGVGGLMLASFYLSLHSLGIGFFVFILSLGMMILTIVPYLYVQVKMLIVYFKLIIKTVYSPIVFAMGAIPGQDDKALKLLKELLAGSLSIIAIAVTLRMAVLLAWYLVLENLETIYQGDLAAVGAAFGGSITVLVIPFVLAFGCFYAGKMPKLIEGAIVGEQKPGGKR